MPVMFAADAIAGTVVYALHIRFAWNVRAACAATVFDIRLRWARGWATPSTYDKDTSMEHRRFVWRVMVAVSWLRWYFLLLLLIFAAPACQPRSSSTLDLLYTRRYIVLLLSSLWLCTCLLFDRSPPSLRLVRSFPFLNSSVVICIFHGLLTAVGMIAAWSHGVEVYLWWTLLCS